MLFPQATSDSQKLGRTRSLLMSAWLRALMVTTMALVAVSCTEDSALAPEQEEIEAQGVWKRGLFFGNEISYLEKDGKLYHQDDILIHPSQIAPVSLNKSTGAGSNHLPFRWPGNIVYYQIHSSLSGDPRIASAMAEISGKTGVSFVSHTSQPNYVRFIASTEASSFVGMIGGMQDINIPSWAGLGTVMHEIYHALGVLHEHTRADRDSHIQIHWGNIKAGCEVHFEKYSKYYNGFDYGEFDWNSIMLYDNRACSKNGLPTIERIGGGAYQVNREALSAYDIAIIKGMYPPLWRGVPGTSKDIGVGANGSVWVIGSNQVHGGYGIYRWNGSGWEQMPGGGVRIDVDNLGNAWVVNSTGSIYRWNGGGWTHIPGAAYDVGCGANGDVWVIGRTPEGGGYSIHKWTGQGWIQVPGGGTKITVDPQGHPYIVNNVSDIYKYSGNGWIQIPGAAVDIASGPDGTLYCLGARIADAGGFGIYKWVGKDWMRTAGSATSIDVGPTGVPWVTNGYLHIYTK